MKPKFYCTQEITIKKSGLGIQNKFWTPKISTFGMLFWSSFEVLTLTLGDF
jgi:hypothetical protein